MPQPPGDPPIRIDHLPYASRLQARALQDVELVVIHCTELPDLAMARSYGERVRYPGSGTGDSGHWYVDRDGAIVEYVPANRVAHHVRGHNERSVGIELVNRGRYPHWFAAGHQAMDEPYTEAQVAALLALLARLRAQLPALRHIAGHEDLDTDEVAATDDPAIRVRRKLDPGVMFPWQRILDGVDLVRTGP